ncbi:unnamed protein product [Staurois parvus]|uniref:Uncharacterized protein n=1 Tax=Staurois parvus TaxID=386267 RepID=A0ABN9HKM0_9NEOB|nr:unnamed protein product [Staurois parvus]
MDMLLCIVLQHVSLVKYTQHTVKQHTVNPLITADVNLFLPSVISTVSVLFISTDHCNSVTGDISGSLSAAPPPPPVCQNARRSPSVPL